MSAKEATGLVRRKIIRICVQAQLIARIDCLTDWGRLTHMCVSKIIIIGSDNGFSPGRLQAIIWSNAGILLTGPLGINLNEISFQINTFSFRETHLNRLQNCVYFVSTSRVKLYLSISIEDLYLGSMSILGQGLKAVIQSKQSCNFCNL